MPGVMVKALNADCLRCGSDPLEPCWPDMHLERVIRAWKYGWVSDAELQAVLESLVTFQLETAFRYAPAAAGRAA